MDKLNQIMQAEDAARVAITDAREQASRMKAEALAAAEAADRESRDETSRLIDQERSRVLKEARTAIEALRAEADAGIEMLDRRAREMQPQALEAVLAAVKGRS
jgi:vacuolar-type H+-ATPase subunit H